MNKYELREKLEEQLRGDCACDFITRKEKMEILDDFDQWAEYAKNGDAYYYGGREYALSVEYELAVWQNEDQRENGEPVYMTPTCSTTDLEAIKREVEAYDIESTGCVEIFEVGEEEPILHYENDAWEDLREETDRDYE